MEKIIDINMIVNAFGEQCLELLLLHTAIACDTVSYPFGKEKISAINILKQGKLDLSITDDQDTSEDDLLSVGRHLFCHLYGAEKPQP